MANRKQFQFFPFHLVDMSPWPILTSFSAFIMAVSAVMCFHGFENGGKLLLLGFVLTATVMVLWFKDVITEGTFLGDHTTQVRRGLTIGFVLFVVSEVFAFLSVFWAFFHSSLAPDISIGTAWPPMGIVALDPFAVPLLNTVLLLSSGAFITWAHHGLIQGNRKAAIYGTIITIIFALVFTGLQYFEYREAGFTMADSVFGSAFYASTGLHGLIMIVPIKKKNYFTLATLGTLASVAADTSPSGREGAESLNLARRLKNKEGSAIAENLEIKTDFLEWFSGFTDAEGNFNITLRKLNNNTYSTAMLTFQITLHLNDFPLLEYIKENLNCGHISISGSRCNYFVNDKDSLIEVILPLFNYVNLNSSKFYQFIVFEKAVNLIKDKKHLSAEG